MYDEDRYSQVATMSDAHREWHQNSGVPMGQPGCPQDACHPVDDGRDDFPFAVDSLWPGSVKCGNRQSPWPSPHYHVGSGEVRECYAASGRFAGAMKVTNSSTGQTALMSSYAGADVIGRASNDLMRAMEKDEPKTAEPESPSKGGGDVMDRVLGVRWGSIPVGGSGYGYYAIEEQDRIRFFRVERPTKGKWAGRTYIKEQASAAFYPIEPKARGYALLTQIATDPEQAGRLYAETLRKCTRCNRPLTLEESRERGMGSDCFKSGGW